MTTPEIYPMPSFTKLSVHDISASTLWYRDKLAFEMIFEMPGPAGVPVLSHLRWAKYADLLLLPEGKSGKERKGVGVSLNFAMGNRSIDKFAEKAISKGVVNFTGPRDQPWNAREFSLQDPDGYSLTFFQPINMKLSFDEVVNNLD
ncbi:MAG: VOC family protein [Lacipirellulaceae bacterium]